jgi:hypothetical protein
MASAARGSVAGLTFTANQYHAIVVRARVSPVNPNTVNQALIRAAFSSAQEGWRALSENQRLLWDDYADSCEYDGPLGRYTVPGRQIYAGNIASAIYLENRGMSVNVNGDSAPSNLGFLGLQIDDVQARTSVGTGFEIAVTNPNPEDVIVYARISRNFDDTRRRFKGPFKSDTIFEVALASLASDVITVTTPTTEQYYFAEVKSICDESPFRMSTSQIVRFTSNTVTPS